MGQSQRWELGEQNVPPQYMSLWYKDHFELVVLRNCRNRRNSENEVRVTFL